MKKKTKKNEKDFKVYDEIYHQTIFLFIGSHKEKNKYLKKNFDLQEQNQKYNGGEASMIYFGDDDYISFIWLPEFTKSINSHCALTHEIQHCVFMIFNKIGIKFDHQNHEMFTYYFEYIYKEFLEQLNA